MKRLQSGSSTKPSSPSTYSAVGLVVMAGVNPSGQAPDNKQEAVPVATVIGLEPVEALPPAISPSYLPYSVSKPNQDYGGHIPPSIPRQDYPASDHHRGGPVPAHPGALEHRDASRTYLQDPKEAEVAHGITGVPSQRYTDPSSIHPYDSIRHGPALARTNGAATVTSIPGAPSRPPPPPIPFPPPTQFVDPYLAELHRHASLGEDPSRSQQNVGSLPNAAYSKPGYPDEPAASEIAPAYDYYSRGSSGRHYDYAARDRERDRERIDRDRYREYASGDRRRRDYRGSRDWSRERDRERDRDRDFDRRRDREVPAAGDIGPAPEASVLTAPAVSATPDAALVGELPEREGRDRERDYGPRYRDRSGRDYDRDRADLSYHQHSSRHHARGRDQSYDADEYYHRDRAPAGTSSIKSELPGRDRERENGGNGDQRGRDRDQEYDYYERDRERDRDRDGDYNQGRDRERGRDRDRGYSGGGFDDDRRSFDRGYRPPPPARAAESASLHSQYPAIYAPDRSAPIDDNRPTRREDGPDGDNHVDDDHHRRVDAALLKRSRSSDRSPSPASGARHRRSEYIRNGDTHFGDEYSREETDRSGVSLEARARRTGAEDEERDVDIENDDDHERARHSRPSSNSGYRPAVKKMKVSTDSSSLSSPSTTLSSMT